MAAFDRRTLVALAASLAALTLMLGCDAVRQGIQYVGGGIGGTGAPASRTADGGIGGTGIIGTVTGFGSILLNGKEIEIVPSTRIERFLEASTLESLRIGQIVAVDAQELGQSLIARTIEQLPAIVGPIARIASSAQTFEVMGQTVRVTADTVLATGDVGLANLAIGQHVEVNGLRTGDGTIIASRVDRVRDDTPALIRGTVTAVDGNQLTIGKLSIEVRDPSEHGAAPGHKVGIVGKLDGDRMLAQRVLVEPDIPFGGHFRRLSIEGVAGESVGATARIVGLPPAELARSALAQPEQFLPGTPVVVDLSLEPNDRLIIQSARSSRSLKRERRTDRLNAPPEIRRSPGRDPGQPPQANPRSERGDQSDDGSDRPDRSDSDGRSRASPDKPSSERPSQKQDVGPRRSRDSDWNDFSRKRRKRR
jgi:hypothetical protein